MTAADQQLKNYELLRTSQQGKHSNELQRLQLYTYSKPAYPKMEKSTADFERRRAFARWYITNILPKKTILELVEEASR
jgi:hypothetical protein